MVDKPRAPVPLPELVGRVAVLGGNPTDKTSLLIRLALRQTRQQGRVLCLDARGQKQTEVQFRLLLRGTASYFSLPASGLVPDEIAQIILSTVSRALDGTSAPAPLLLLDSVVEDQGWEQTLTFLLNAGVTVVELLPSPAALRFGRYDTVLLLHAEQHAAGVLSRAVGRKVSETDLATLKDGEGILVHLGRSHWVTLPET